MIPQKGKSRISIYLDDKILEEFRTRADAAGRGYQTMINDALREYLGRSARPLDVETFRRIPPIGRTWNLLLRAPNRRRSRSLIRKGHDVACPGSALFRRTRSRYDGCMSKHTLRNEFTAIHRARWEVAHGLLS